MTGTRGRELSSAACFGVLGVAIGVASWRMDRLADRGIEPWSAPGLMPGLVGALMTLFALVLAWRAWRGGVDARGASSQTRAAEATKDGADVDADAVAHAAAGDVAGAAHFDDRPSTARTALAAMSCVLFALAAPATPLPFALDAALFVAAFIAVFGWRRWRAERRVARGVLQAALVAAIAAPAIAWLFESVFLVRLP